jgi:hypothetical protein
VIQFLDNRSPLYLTRIPHQVALALRVYPPASRVDSLGIACSPQARHPPPQAPRDA